MGWQLGQSGNPNGSHGSTRKSKGERLSDLANNYTASALNVIVGVMEDPTVRPADRLLAARMVLDRAVGTPVQAVTVSNNLTVSLVELLAGLPGQGKPPTIEHEEQPPPMVAGISLMEAASAASELDGDGAGGLCAGLEAEFLPSSARPAVETADQAAGQVEEEDGELVLRPANDDSTPTQPGGE